MTTKHNLDTPGVQAAVAAIYAMSAIEQAQIRQAIRSDLRAWLHANFLLSPAQSDYLDAMPADALIMAGNQVADALEEQVEFLYVQSSPPKDDDRKGKELLMGTRQMQRIAPILNEETLFMILVNYYGD